MSIAALILIGLGLSLDNFADAMAIGASATARTAGAVLRVPIVFAAFQFVMPLCGWTIGSRVVALFHGYGNIVVFLTLAFVGWRIVRSARTIAGKRNYDVSSTGTLLGLGLATSVDALGVGFGLAMTTVSILQASFIISGVTLFISLVGVLFGERIGRVLGTRSKYFAGAVLLAVGVKALFSH